MASVSTTHLIDLTQEILLECFKHLDLKSSVMMTSVCKKFSHLDNKNKLIHNKKIMSLGTIIKECISVLKLVYDTLHYEPAREHMMADLLRKLIYVSVSNSHHFNTSQSSIAYDHCQMEYTRLYLYYAEQMDITMFEFNNLLEDAQFEFRGYNIIDKPVEHRSQLNMFKDTIKGLYFNGAYTVQLNMQYLASCIEIHFDGNKIVFDVHLQESNDNLIFLQDLISDWLKKTQDIVLKNKFESSNIVIDRNQMHWSIDNSEAPYIIAELILLLMPDGRYFQGADAFNIELWNNIIEENWLLNEVVKEMIDRNNYETMICNVSYQVTDEYLNI